ncbi:hypothetical protein RJT34_16145 [Clitoria ternatea]|uniref:Cation efflux protein transmembrane domain-containing protein n=1 Tax=Clitoria ternatea TaxID=43366 RepID=A0AAN9PDD9_CLITE
MADHPHHHQHRPHRLSVPPRTTTFTTTTSRQPFPTSRYSSSTPTPTPSKTRRLPPLSNPKSKSKFSLSSLFVLLFSLRSLYSLLPFLRSSPSFSLFPFSFLVSLLSFFLTLSFSLLSSSSSSSSVDPFNNHKPKQPLFSLSSLTLSQQRILVSKSIVLALIFILRFQALRYCGTASMILAELIGSIAAAQPRNLNRPRARGSVSLFLGLFLLSFGWDRIECFPFNCVRVWALLLPFMSGFLASYERVSMMDWGTVKQLGQKRVRVITLFFTTVVLFIPAVISFFAFEDSVTFGNLAWPLANTVVFGVLLSDDSLVSFKDSQREFLVTFVCTLVLELFYFPQLSLWGLLLCGLLLYVAVRDLDPFRSDDVGSEEELLSDMIMKPIRHVLSERKSRKIALFLLINAGYMVVEFVAGFMSNSLGLISDACHMLFDCAALAIGLYASYISRLPANNHYNYGRGRFEVLSGYANAVFLVLVGALIVVESFERILDPQEISTNSLLVVSIGGLVVNVMGLIFFHEEHHHAHGLSGSCSHSHGHTHSDHSHHSHHHNHHDQRCHGDHHHGKHGVNEEFISVSSDCHDNSCSDDPGHHNCFSQKGKDECHADKHSHQSFKHDHKEQHGHHSHEKMAECHVDNHAIHHHIHDHGAIHHKGKAECHADEHSHQSFKHDHKEQHGHHSHGKMAEGHVDNHTIHHRIHDHGATHHHDHGEHHDQTDHCCHEASPVHPKHSHRHIDHNMEGIFLHVLADTMGSVGVVISTLLIKYKGWLVADPTCSIFISILIVSSVIPLLRNSAEVLLQRVPRVHEHELKEALTNVLKIKGVYGIQKFHLWSFTNTDVVGTLHLHVSTDNDKTSAKTQVLHLLHNAGIKDLTLQVECVG